MSEVRTGVSDWSDEPSPNPDRGVGAIRQASPRADLGRRIARTGLSTRRDRASDASEGPPPRADRGVRLLGPASPASGSGIACLVLRQDRLETRGFFAMLLDASAGRHPLLRRRGRARARAVRVACASNWMGPPDVRMDADRDVGHSRFLTRFTGHRFAPGRRAIGQHAQRVCLVVSTD